MTEKISIVVPVYNTEPYLEDFFTRMVDQTFKDYKVYLVYDVSSDNSLNILKKYEASFPEYFEVLYSPKKDGLGAARDYALDSGKINGDYVMFLDPDDYPDKNFLEKLYNEAIKTGADITMCGFERFDDETGDVICTEMVHNPTELITDIENCDLLAYMNPVVWDKLYKRKLVEQIRFTNIKRTEDVFWLLRMIPSIHSIKCINEVLYHYRSRSDSLLNTLTEKAYDEVSDALISISKEFEQNGFKSSKYWDLIEFIVFCRFGIGVTYRVSKTNKNKAKLISNRTKALLDAHFCNWKKNKFLSFRHCASHKIKGIAIWGCGLLYKINKFPIYVKLYSFMQRHTKTEVRW